MKIIYGTLDNIKTFNELEVGTIFIDDENDICIKTDADDQKYNTVRLSDGVVFWTFNQIRCQAVDATLIIKPKGSEKK